MSNTISDMFRMEDLRKKILFTLLILAITRVGAVIPVPGVNPRVLSNYFDVASKSDPPICSISIMVRSTDIRAIGGFPEGRDGGAI